VPFNFGWTQSVVGYEKYTLKGVTPDYALPIKINLGRHPHYQGWIHDFDQRAIIRL
jgi:hypothetical protein